MSLFSLNSIISMYSSRYQQSTSIFTNGLWERKHQQPLFFDQWLLLHFPVTLHFVKLLLPIASNFVAFFLPFEIVVIVVSIFTVDEGETQTHHHPLNYGSLWGGALCNLCGSKHNSMDCLWGMGPCFVFQL